MRNISFSLTTPQFIDGTKDVTRRMGWLFLKAGDRLQAVEKSQGLGKGGKIKRLGVICILNVRREVLDAISDDLGYGRREVDREGFPEIGINQFIMFFCSGHKGCKPSSIITRIEFVREPGNG